MKTVSVILALALISTPALAEAKKVTGQGEASQCTSPGAAASNQGEWLRLLKEHPALLDMNPAEMADKENITEGWTGEGQTPNVGAFIDFFCESGGDR